MPSPTARFAIALLWIVSVGGAYWTGREWKEVSATREDGDAGPVAVTMVPAGAAAEAGGSGEEKAADGEPQTASADARQVLAKARREMGPGMSSMMNPSTMFRALGPLMTMPASEIRGALAEVAATVEDPQQRAMFETLLLGRWAEEDPSSALTYAEKLLEEGGPMAAQALMGVVSTWASHDPEAAWTWYLKRRDSDEVPLGANGFDSSLIAIFSATSNRDLDSALAKISELDDDNSRNLALMGISLSGMDAQKRKGILDRSESLDPDTRQTLRQNVLSQWAQTEPDAVMDWLRSLPAGERASLTNRTSHALVGNNPEKAAAFLMEDATEENLGQRYSAIVSGWANRDPMAAGEWLNRQPKNPAQDQARQHFANRVVGIDPEAAMEWSKSISTESTRESSIRNVYRQWHRRDADAADTALGNSGLAADKIAEIRKSLSK